MTQQTVNYQFNNTPVNITLLNQETPQTITQCLPVLNTHAKEVNNPLIFKLNNLFTDNKENINNTKDGLKNSV